MKMCSISLVISKMQVKTAMKCHYLLTRMAKIRNTKTANVGTEVKQQMWNIHCGRECKMVQSLEDSFCFLQNKAFFYHTAEQSCSLLFTQRSGNLTSI